MSVKIRQGDEVMVLSGKDRGKRGRILKVLPREMSVLVEGVNLVKKHRRPNPALELEGGVFEQEALLPVCKVAIYNPETGCPDRVGFLVDPETGKKRRVFKKSSGSLIDRE